MSTENLAADSVIATSNTAQNDYGNSESDGIDEFDSQETMDLFLPSMISRKSASETNSAASSMVSEAKKLLTEKSTSHLSKEEFEELACKIQKTIREERIKREKQDELEAERNRLRLNKTLLDQRAKLEEEQRKRNIEQFQREKIEHAKERQRQLQLLKEEWAERMGKDSPYNDSEAQKKNDVANINNKSSKDRVIYYCGRLKKLYKDSDVSGLKLCLDTLKRYFTNIQSDPGNVKFRTIRLENDAFKCRILKYPEALKLMEVIGFEKGESCISIQSFPDGFLIGLAIKYINVILNEIS